MLQGGAQKAYHKAIDPGKQTFMEAAGIEPASAVAPNRASTSVVRALVLPGGRFANDLPTGQPSLSLALRAIGIP